jgi:MFS family permease
MQREFTDAQRSTMGSLTAFGGSLFFAVMSVALGWLADTIGIREALIVVNLFLFMPLIFFWLAFRRDSTKIPVPNTAYVEAD